jgi:hypothetical protein
MVLKHITTNGKSMIQRLSWRRMLVFNKEPDFLEGNKSG